MAVRENSDDKKTIKGTNSADDITNHGGQFVTINALGGDDSVHSWGREIWADDDRLLSVVNPHNAVINVGEGNNFVENYGGIGVSITAGAGDDSIYNRIEHERGEEDEEEFVTPDNATINAGAGNDYIENEGSNVSINAGNGDDTIGSNAFNSTLLGGDGNDVINGDADNVSINGGAGNDTIDYHGLNNTISGGTGDDSIRNNWSHNLVYVYGGGNDTIRDFRHENNFLVIEGHSWSTLRVQDDDGNNTDAVIVSVLDGKKVIGTVTLKECWSDDISICASKADVKLVNLILNDHDGESLTGTDDKDYVESNAPNVTIKTGNGDDIIYNWNNDEWDHDELISRISPDNSLIDAGNGNNHVNNDGNNSTIKTGSGNDYVWNSGDNVSISVGAGNDYVDNINAHNAVKIDLGAGDDIVDNNASDSTLLGGDGKDLINSNASKVSINAGKGDDSIFVGGDNNTVAGGTGNDFIQNGSAALAYVYSGGNDTIENFNYFDTLVISGASWEINKVLDDDGNETGTVIINVTGKGSITLNNCQYRDNIKIVSSIAEVQHASFIYSEDSNTVIIGSSARDSIDSRGDNVSINAGNGDNAVQNGGWNDELQRDAGGNYSTIVTGNGNDSVWNVGDNASINTGAGDDSINNGGWSNEFQKNVGGEFTTINSGDGNDYIWNIIDNVSINAGKGNDNIWTGGDNVTVGGGAGNDDIYNEGEGFAYVYTGGNDTLNNFHDYDKLVLGKLKIKSSVRAEDSGNVTLNISNGGSIILANYWNDNVQTVESASQVEKVNVIRNDVNMTTVKGTSGKDIIYSKGEWDDEFETFAGYFNVSINAGADDDRIETGGRNIRVTAGDGNDTVYNWGTNATISGGNGDDYVENYNSNVSINGGAGDDSVYNNGNNSTLLGGSGNDFIYNDWSDFVTVNAGAGNDTINNGGDNVTINGGSGNDFVENWGMGMAYVYTGGNDTIYGLDDYGTLVLGKLKITSSVRAEIADNDSITSNVTLTMSNSNSIVLANYWSDEVNTVTSVADVEQINYIDNRDSNTEVTGTSGRDIIYNNRVVYWDDNDNPVYSDKVTINSGAGDDYIRNSGSNAEINAGKGDDTIDNDGLNAYIDAGKGDDIVHNDELNATILGGKGDDTIVNDRGNNVLFKYKTGDGNDSISGFREDSTLKIDGSYSTTKSGSDVVVTVGDGKIILSGAASLSAVHIEGTATTMTLTNSSKAAVTLPASIVLADASKRTSAAIKITGNALDNSIVGGSKNDTLYGKEGNDYLAGNAGVDKLYGGNGADTIWGGAGNDSLWGNEGNDLFIHSAGNDIIADYAAGDVISLGAAITNASLSSSNVVLTTESGKLTVKNAKDKTLSLITADGKELSTIVSDAMILTNDSKAAVTMPTSIGSADATARTSAIKITGNALDNSILGGAGKDTLYGKDGADYLAGGAGVDKLYGGNGNDTLIGGAGNDSLWGNDGADTFVYNSGDGKDVIVGFANDDMLQITGTFSASLNSAGNVVFKVGSTASAITLKNFTATTFNVNGDAYKISGSKLVK